jgi:hypothetical protein
MAWKIASSMHEFVLEYRRTERHVNDGGIETSQVEDTLNTLDDVQSYIYVAICSLAEHDRDDKLYKMLRNMQSRFYGDKSTLESLKRSIMNEAARNFDKELDEAYEEGWNEAISDVKDKLSNMEI